MSWRRCALRSSMVAVMVLRGEAVPRFDLVMGLIGGSLTGPLMFILPPLFYARLRRMSWRARLLRTQPPALAPPALPWVREHDKVSGSVSAEGQRTGALACFRPAESLIDTRIGPVYRCLV